ncbi:FAD-dependent oxidoreductase [Acidocella sp. MX-AZ03]|uniref:FAD-dependent oxidoreductase n=1 Tax=Acidocella sp. MX-AZ03 TaxID=2697363 RepID=UPI0022DDC958|nr:FAD-dependent oxidoreductase [Acidocella sp. MX-AZ03]WBO61184.1 FAD-dependent oxidoreductase [Acidocella sp. MX-AZ03]
MEPAAFEPRSHLLGDPRDVKAMSYGIRPMGLPTIEAYLGNDSAEIITREGPVAAYAAAMDGLAKLLGADVRKQLRPLITTDWTRTTHIGGSYSYARPGQRSARATLARPFENRLFFAGEATHATDFSTAHGAYESGVRAATEVLGAMTRVG